VQILNNKDLNHAIEHSENENQRLAGSSSVPAMQPSPQQKHVPRGQDTRQDSRDNNEPGNFQ
jgi:hypothetical protein